MSGAAVRLLALLCVLLGATLALEASMPAPGSDDPETMTGIRAAPRLPRLDSVQKAAQAVDHTDAWVATILARPLFSRNRRPSAERVAEASATEGLPRLTGIAVSPAGRSAIFAGSSPGGKPIVVGEGGSVGAYTVRSIRPDQVQVEGPGGTRTVAPAFDPTPHTPETPPQMPAIPAGQMQVPTPPVPRLPLAPGSPLMVPRQPFNSRLQPQINNGASLQPGRFGRDLADSDNAPS